MPHQARLEINRNPDRNNEFYVKVTLTGYINPPPNAKVSITVKGEDEWVDDQLFSYPAWPHNRLDSYFDLGGRTYSLTSGSVSGGKLNEDWGNDEIVATVKVSGFYDVKTNTVRGNWS